MTDLIGDIHGHADELEELLKKLGYSKTNGAYSHPERKVLFAGDYIDRGPKIRKTLKIVRSMVEAGSAIAIMGNHEYNALCFHLEESEGGHLRKHLIKNVIQHYKTLHAFQNRQAEYEDYLDWFMTLPLYYETETYRAVHACWDNENIELLRKTLTNDRLTEAEIHEAVKRNTPLYNAMEDTLKGKELRLPNNGSFIDADGEKRRHTRIKWWENPKGKTYKSLSVTKYDALPETLIDLDDTLPNTYYGPNEKPVFFGHYWLRGNPSLFRNNICCLDYSVAKKGKLVAYRHDGELILDEKKFVFV